MRTNWLYNHASATAAALGTQNVGTEDGERIRRARAHAGLWDLLRLRLHLGLVVLVVDEEEHVQQAALHCPLA